MGHTMVLAGKNDQGTSNTLPPLTAGNEDSPMRSEFIRSPAPSPEVSCSHHSPSAPDSLAQRSASPQRSGAAKGPRPASLKPSISRSNLKYEANKKDPRIQEEPQRQQQTFSSVKRPFSLIPKPASSTANVTLFDAVAHSQAPNKLHKPKQPSTLTRHVHFTPEQDTQAANLPLLPKMKAKSRFEKKPFIRPPPNGSHSPSRLSQAPIPINYKNLTIKTKRDSFVNDDPFIDLPIDQPIDYRSIPETSPLFCTSPGGSKYDASYRSENVKVKRESFSWWDIRKNKEKLMEKFNKNVVDFEGTRLTRLNSESKSIALEQGAPAFDNSSAPKRPMTIHGLPESSNNTSGRLPKENRPSSVALNRLLFPNANAQQRAAPELITSIDNAPPSHKKSHGQRLRRVSSTSSLIPGSDPILSERRLRNISSTANLRANYAAGSNTQRNSSNTPHHSASSKPSVAAQGLNNAYSLEHLQPEIPTNWKLPTSRQTSSQSQIPRQNISRQTSNTSKTSKASNSVPLPRFFPNHTGRDGHFYGSKPPQVEPYDHNLVLGGSPQFNRVKVRMVGPPSRSRVASIRHETGVYKALDRMKDDFGRITLRGCCDFYFSGTHPHAFRSLIKHQPYTHREYELCLLHNPSLPNLHPPTIIALLGIHSQTHQQHGTISGWLAAYETTVMTGLLGTLFPLDLEGGDSKINLDDSCCAPRLIAKIISLEPLGKTAEMHRLDKLIPGAVQNYSSTSVASSTRDGSGVGGMENCGTGSNVSLVSANKSTTVAASLGPGVTIRPLSPTKLALQKVLGGIRGVWETVGLGAGGSGGGGGIPGGPYENGLNQHMEATGTMVMPGLGSVNRRDGIEEEREVVRVKAGWEFSSSSKLGRINELAIGEREFRGVVEWRVEYEYEGSK